MSRAQETLADIHLEGDVPHRASPDEIRAALRAALPALLWYALRERGLVAGDRPPGRRTGRSTAAPPIEMTGEPLSASVIRDRR